MAYTFLLLFCIGCNQPIVHSYDKDIELLSTIYRGLHDPYKDVNQLDKVTSPELQQTKAYVKEYLTHKEHKLISTLFLKKPDLETLKAVYLLRHINWNSMTMGDLDVPTLIKGVEFEKYQEIELLATYYAQIFNRIGGEFKSQNYGQTNIEMNKLDLTNTEQAVLFYASLPGFVPKYKLSMRSNSNPCQVASNYLKTTPRYNGKSFLDYTPAQFKKFPYSSSLTIRDLFSNYFKKYHTESQAVKEHCESKG